MKKLELNIQIIKSFIALVFIVIVLFPVSSTAQKCSLTLTVKNNVESVNSEGRVYFMVLKNNEAEGIDVKFTLANNNTGDNPDESKCNSNVNLVAAVLDTEEKPLKGSLRLKPNETVEFRVKVTVPANTPLERWNKTLVRAYSEKCPNYSASLVLYTFIPVPE
jgi:hypothetical protein